MHVFPLIQIVLLTTLSNGLSAAGPLTEEFPVEKIGNPVSIELDAHSVPTIIAKSQLDAFAGQGFMHARDRFFQMDLMRRQAAGEISELVGSFAIELDKPRAILRRRALATRILSELPSNEQAMLRRYTDGVNAGISSLESPPVEYATLGVPMQPWIPQDTILVQITMMDMLERHDGNERAINALRKLVPNAYADWLMMQVGEFESLVIQPDVPETIPPPPSASVVDVRKHASNTTFPPIVTERTEALGSNNFAVAGSRSSDGRAILANDPHLRITAPAIWYRCRMEWPDHELTGLSLPGVPGIVIGTNGHVAMGMTNTTGDFRDNVIIEVDPDDPTRYRVGDDWEPFDVEMVKIKVRGEDDLELESRWTRWGPVLGTDGQGRPLAELSVAWQPGAVNFTLHEMADARTVDDAIHVARRWYGPSQNVLVADADGRIGWVLSGWIPNRQGYDGLEPTSLADGSGGWFGPLPEEQRPMVVDPESGYLFTANSRTVPLAMSTRIGNGFANPCRSYRIQQRLSQLEDATEADLLDIQLDEFAQLLVSYRPLLLQGLEMLPQYAERDDLINIITAWDGYASEDAMAVLPLDFFRSTLISETRAALLKGFEGQNKRRAANAIRENAILAGFKSRPENLLLNGESEWDALLMSAAAKTLKEEEIIAWGEANRSRFQHPLAIASPSLGDGFDLPSTPQSGYHGAVRVATPVAGASARIIVSPGHLDDAILQTPGGQSGNPFSAHYTDLHQVWLEGAPTPLLPGKPEHKIELVPKQ